MLLPLLATWLAAQAGPMTDTVVDPVALYAPVLEHVRSKQQAERVLPIIFNEAVSNVGCVARCSDLASRMHAPELLEQLRTARLIEGTCLQSSETQRCASRQKAYLFVRVGPVINLRAGARVKVIPEETTPGMSLDELLAAIPESAAVPVHAAVDVVVLAPCSDPPGPDRCRFPNLVSYRYFLRAQSGGVYRVATRWQTGAA